MSKKDNIATFACDLGYPDWLQAVDSFKYDNEIVKEVVNTLCPDTTSYKQGIEALFNELEEDEKKELLKKLSNGLI